VRHRERAFRKLRRTFGGVMKKTAEQKAGINPPPDSPRSEIKEIIQSLQDIARKIEKLTTEKEKK
jgi:hypothetical protein